MIEFSEIASELLPLSLLLEADPSEECIRRYLSDSWCFAAISDATIVGACVTKPMGSGRAEIFSIAVSPECQQQGIGTKLLQYVLDQLSKREIKHVELSTGTFGYQLTFYQRLGFRVDSVVKDFFLNRCSEPIFENGLQHKDMLRLVCSLSPT